MSEQSRQTSESPKLDAEEHLHLGLKAIQSGQDYVAIAHLKQARSLEPENGVVTYMLAAQHAQLGMFDRAVEEMREALRQAPDLEMARFQLGLLLTARDETVEARELFQPLANGAQVPALEWFAGGLIDLIDEKVADCRAKVEKGLAVNHDNPALNNDMQRILAQLPDGEADAGVAAQAAAPPADRSQNEADEATSNSLYLSLYKKGDTH